jgi:hypothetical protein
VRVALSGAVGTLECRDIGLRERPPKVQLGVAVTRAELGRVVVRIALAGRRPGMHAGAAASDCESDDRRENGA